jgi:hypothetical protein
MLHITHESHLRGPFFSIEAIILRHVCTDEITIWHVTTTNIKTFAMQVVRQGVHCRVIAAIGCGGKEFPAFDVRHFCIELQSIATFSCPAIIPAPL